MATGTVSSLIRSLREDSWRRANPFSADIETASAILNHPYATLPERETAVSRWLQKFQPCLFGRVAAATKRMHYCVLTDDDLRGSDRSIRDKIVLERALWKQRALRGSSNAPHGFLLLVTAPRVLWAAPDENLRRLSLRIREMWGCTVEADDRGNDRAWEYLYLKHPTTGDFYRFTFTVDFFAGAADGRWWHDHRVPGGIAFTANSLGHMAAVREWNEGKRDQEQWAIKVSMLTIAEAAATPAGPATSLVGLDRGIPMKDATCPFSGNRGDLPAALHDKDWTVYQGVLHTDHSIRDEFFAVDEKPPLRARPWLMDFTYIYDHRQEDYTRFMRGQVVSQEEVYREVGPPGDWRTLSERQTRIARRPRGAVSELRALLAQTESWSLSGSRLRRLTA